MCGHSTQGGLGTDLQRCSGSPGCSLVGCPAPWRGDVRPLGAQAAKNVSFLGIKDCDLTRTEAPNCRISGSVQESVIQMFLMAWAGSTDMALGLHAVHRSNFFVLLWISLSDKTVYDVPCN